MNNSLLTNNYFVIDNFIDAERALFLGKQFQSDCMKYPHLFQLDEQCPYSPAMYNYPYFLELLIEKIPDITEIVGELVYPTYSYARNYINNDELKPHTDRNACEISVTLNLYNDGVSWPIYFTKPDGTVNGIDIKAGQAVVYLGCQSQHWRRKFTGQEYVQVFLHYVKARGNNRHYYFDKIK